MAIMAGLADKRLRQQIEYLTEETRDDPPPRDRHQ